MKEIVFAVVLLLCSSAAFACTGITVKTQDGSVIGSRTLEFEQDLGSDVILIPRNYKMQATMPDGSPGLAWTQKYAALGMNALNQPKFADGFNEKGLSAGSFYLPGYAEYTRLTPENKPRAILSVDFPTWVLANFATVDEVKANLDKVAVVAGALPGVPIEMPLHYRVTDASGKALVVEYTNGGQVKAYDDPFGVITNSPTFDWHLTNLGNYLNLSPENAPTRDIAGMTVRSFGQGTGMLGLPGDFTPPSRFVRALALQQSALPVRTADEGVVLAWTIINNITIPKGAARGVSPNGQPTYDHTEWTTVSDLRNLKLYFRLYDNPEIRMVSMREMNLDCPSVMVIKTHAPPQYRDLTPSATAAEFK